MQRVPGLKNQKPISIIWLDCPFVLTRCINGYALDLNTLLPFSNASFSLGARGFEVFPAQQSRLSSLNTATGWNVLISASSKSRKDPELKLAEHLPHGERPFAGRSCPFVVQCYRHRSIKLSRGFQSSWELSDHLRTMLILPPRQSH